MSRKLIGKVTLYYGSGDAAEERGERMDAAAKRRGFLNKKGEPELSPLMVYCFEAVDSLDPRIEAQAAKAGLSLADYVNKLYRDSAKRED